MEFKLVVRTGDAAGKAIPVPAGESRRIGRQHPSDVRVADDPMLSNQHFSVECDGNVCLLRDLGSRFGTLLNGKPIGEAAALRDGDEIRAGRTTFAVALAGDLRATPNLPADATAETPKPAAHIAAAEPLSDQRRAVLDHLKKLAELHVILDAAREATVIDRMKASGETFASLYEGDEGEELSAYGPWLVRLSTDKPFLEELVRDGWGKSWGVYLACDRPFPEVRRHLRQFLLAKLPDGRQVCFRYYDPRVLRTYLPTCSAEELAKFCGPVERYLAESADESELLEFGANYRDWRKVRLEP